MIFEEERLEVFIDSEDIMPVIEMKRSRIEMTLSQFLCAPCNGHDIAFIEHEWYYYHKWRNLCKDSHIRKMERKQNSETGEDFDLFFGN